MADNASENVKAFELDEFCSDDIKIYDDDDILSDDGSESSDEDGGYTLETGHDVPHCDMDEENEEEYQKLEDALQNGVDWTTSAFKRMGCCAHALQLVIKDSVKLNKLASDMLEKVTRIISFFHKTSYWNHKLVGKTKLELVRPGATRWNSFVFALDRLLTV
jgi:hypothetical protein